MARLPTNASPTFVALVALMLFATVGPASGAPEGAPSPTAGEGAAGASVGDAPFGDAPVGDAQAGDAEAADGVTSITIGAGGPFGFQFAAAGAICEAVIRANEDLRCTVEPGGDSQANITAMMAGRVDLAVVQSDWLHHAVHGTSRFVADGANDALRAVFSLHGESLTVMLRAAAEATTTQELASLRLSGGDSGTYRGLLTRWLFAAAGVDAPAALQGPGPAPAELCKDGIDAATLVSAHPSALVTDLMGRCRVRLLSLPKSVVERAVANRPYLAPLTIPAGTYPVQSGPVDSFGLRVVLAAHADTPPQILEAVLKAVVGNLSAFRDRHPVLAGLDRETMATSALGAPLHATAQAYFSAASKTAD